ncbi:MAG: YceI family protein [Bdellovibrionales bacterium]|jgi:polyisoprenoid-binding protein YceI|nr:YceI family protein [Bdellovibrionales bacterium]
MMGFKKTAMLAMSAAALVFAAQANAETYKIDPASSTITWKATKKVAGGHNGTIAVKEGQVEVSKKGEVTAGTVVGDLKQIVALDLQGTEHHAKFVGHMQSADFFNVEKAGHDVATFKLTSVTKKGAQHIAKGDLTFNGKTNPIEFPLTFKVDKGVATGEGSLKVDRTKWDLKYGSGNFFKLAADKVINDEFELGFKLTAKK